MPRTAAAAVITGKAILYYGWLRLIGKKAPRFFACWLLNEEWMNIHRESMFFKRLNYAAILKDFFWGEISHYGFKM